MKKHLHRLGTIYLVYGWFGVLMTIISILMTIQDIQRLEDGMNVAEWQPITLILIGLTLLIGLFSLIYLLFGRALKREKAWATRAVGFIIGVLLIFQFPIGTIIGGYTLWVLVKLDQAILTGTEPER